jgi:hypothetical protein
VSEEVSPAPVRKGTEIQPRVPAEWTQNVEAGYKDGRHFARQLKSKVTLQGELMSVDVIVQAESSFVLAVGV